MPTENATPPKSTKSRNSNSSVPIQIKPKAQFEFVLRDTENLEFLDVVDFGGVAIAVETVRIAYLVLYLIYFKEPYLLKSC